VAECEIVTHQTVLEQEAVTALLTPPVADGTYIDATYGGGGHSTQILSKLTATATLLALDCDEWAEKNAATITDSRFVFKRSNFFHLQEMATEAGIASAHGVLFDLGVSSPQLDVAERGLSFQRTGPLDMRLDRRQKTTVAHLLATEDEQTLIHIFKTYGEEPEARRVAKAICAKRHEITDTTSLAKVVADSKRLRMPGRHPATLVFQALRMEVNSELANLRRGLEAACKLLATRGRLVVISFHSLEDRLVKHLLRGPAFPGVGRINQLNMEAVGNLVTPSEDEVAANPRARSARMRVFVKLAAL
jgi:16S rRNA (cytosine1402-N4)-methyltransferase